MTATQLGFVGGLALYDTVQGLAGEGEEPAFALKWPNDLLCNTRKTGGILLESTSDKTGAIAVVMGIGLNLSDHPQGTEYPATDLIQHGIETTPAEALNRLAQACDHWLGVWDTGTGFMDIRAAWMERSLPENAPIEVKLSDERLQGTYRGIDDEGALILALGDGGERRITTGDIFPL
jgi:BirA family biotin operon repressor/biotin-[acetyl-CoA-carboxylase] ligase